MRRSYRCEFSQSRLYYHSRLVQIFRHRSPNLHHQRRSLKVQGWYIHAAATFFPIPLSPTARQGVAPLPITSSPRFAGQPVCVPLITTALAPFRQGGWISSLFWKTVQAHLFRQKRGWL